MIDRKLSLQVSPFVSTNLSKISMENVTELNEHTLYHANVGKVLTFETLGLKAKL